MDNQAEVDFIHTQLEANKFCLGHLQQNTSFLLQIVARNRKSIEELTKFNDELVERLNSLGFTDQAIVKYS